MTGISCFVPLDDAGKKQVAELAKKLKWSETETGNAIGAWQTANNSLFYTTIVHSKPEQSGIFRSFYLFGIDCDPCCCG